MDQFNTAFSVGSFGMSWNAVMLALGILTAVVVSEILVKKRKAYKDLALDACIVGILSGLIGARLFSAISGKIAFSQFFSLGSTGMNLPGALLFCSAAIAVYARIKKLDLGETFDLLTPGAFFGLAVGRWSDFFLCDGLGKTVSDVGAKFFPLATFTKEYFTDGVTVAYAVFFLDFLICAGLGFLALFASKKLEKGRSARLTIILYLFAEFILEWLREKTARQVVFGDVRFNQLPLMAMLLFFIGLSLYRARRPKTAKAAETEPEVPAAEPENVTEPVSEEPDQPGVEEIAEAPEETAEDGAECGADGDGGDE